MTKNRPPHLIGAAAYSFPAVFQRGPGMLRAVLVVAVSRLLNVIQIIVVQERAAREHFLIDPEMQLFRQAEALFGNLNAVFQRIAAAVLGVVLHLPDLRIFDQFFYNVEVFFFIVDHAIII